MGERIGKRKEEKDGGKGWRKRMEEKDREKDGGKGWRKRIGKRMGG